MTRSRLAATTLALVLCACESAPQGISRPPAHDHFGSAVALPRAIVEGRLVDARDGAHAIAIAAGRSAAPLRDVGEAAERVAQADDLGTAAVALGPLGRACGSCHESVAAVLALDTDPAPADDGSLPSHMRRQAWAAQRLWEGLVVPDDVRWQAGARTIATSRLDLVGTVRDRPNAEVFWFAEQLRERASVALAGVTPEPRIYAEMLVACVGCHDVTRLRPLARR